MKRFLILEGSRKRKILLAVAAVLVLLVLAAGVLYLTDPYGLHMAPNVSVGGIDVSGMSVWDAHKAVSSALEESLYSQPLEVHLPQETLILQPEELSPKVRIFPALVQAFRIGRGDSQGGGDVPLLPYLTVKEDYLLDVLHAYADTYDTVLTQPNWKLEGNVPNLSTAECDPDAPCQMLRITVGTPEAHLDIEAAQAQVLEVLSHAVPSCADGTYRLTISVTPDALPDTLDIAQIQAETCMDPVNDSLDMTSYQFVHGSYGYRFDPLQLGKELRSAQPGQTITLPFQYVQPEILGEGVYFRDVLGKYETRHTNNENRNTNLRLLCAALDGYILQPGEEFSYNAVVGERSAERGYKPAPAYSGNRLVDSIGGGVCQGSTTLYNCVLLADLEVVFRACHGASVGYVPRGLDAAVNYLTTDFKFRNNFHFPIMIRAEVSDGYVKMQILGTDEKDYYIVMESLSGEDDIAVYSRSYKCKYDKTTGELISRDLEAYSTYYKSIG